MHYDPIKQSLGRLFNRSVTLRKIFYRLLDILFLRTWHIKKEVREWAKTHPVDQPFSLLDAGSGFGQYTYYLAGLSRKWKVTAVDVKEDQVAECSRFFTKTGRTNATFRVDDLTELEDKDLYDLILCVDVMEHIADDERVFGNFHESLKPGGMVLISTPSDRGGSDIGSEDDESFIGEHVRDGYGMEEIRQKLATAGFTKTEARYSYGRPGQVSWKLSMKMPMMMAGKSKVFLIILPFYYLLVMPCCLYLNYLDTRRHHASGTGLIVKAWK